MATDHAPTLDVEIVTPETAHRLAEFAARDRLVWNDFASVAAQLPEEPRIWSATDGRAIHAAAIDDGMAMSVAGSSAGLAAIARSVPDLDEKLVISGRDSELEAFVAERGAGRRMRYEHFMTVTREQLLVEAELLPLRIATPDDIPALVEGRAHALWEEYGVRVEAGGEIMAEIQRGVERAVRMGGIAIWTEEGGGIAFTAQLIAKTPQASTFGDLFTSPELRGAGRATRGLATFCVWLMSESECVTLRVGVDNEPALRLYERVGFQVVDRFASSLSPNAPY